MELGITPDKILGRMAFDGDEFQDPVVRVANDFEKLCSDRITETAYLNSPEYFKCCSAWVTMLDVLM